MCLLPPAEEGLAFLPSVPHTLPGCFILVPPLSEQRSGVNWREGELGEGTLKVLYTDGRESWLSCSLARGQVLQPQAPQSLQL